MKSKGIIIKYSLNTMLFDTFVWDVIKSYVIDYRKVEIRNKLLMYESIGRLSNSYVSCYCQRIIKLSKYSNHLKSKSHQSVCKTIYNQSQMIDIPKILYFDLLDLLE